MKVVGRGRPGPLAWIFIASASLFLIGAIYVVMKGVASGEGCSDQALGCVGDVLFAGQFGLLVLGIAAPGPLGLLALVLAAAGLFSYGFWLLWFMPTGALITRLLLLNRSWWLAK